MLDMKSYVRLNVSKIKTLYTVVGLFLIFILFIIGFTLTTNRSQETDQYKQVISSIKVNNDRVNQIIDYRYDDPDILASLDDYLP